jgi:exodeoxyribonuclease VII large subunit
MTIADYCADVRAATPSAACELAIPDMTSFYTRMHNYQEVLGTLLQQKLMLMYGKTALLERQLEAQRPDKKLMSHQLIYERLEGRLQQAMRDKYQSRQQQFTRYVDRLSALSPTSRLRGGYVFAQTKEGNPLTSAGQIEKENPFFITFSDGQAEVMPVSVKKNKK